MLCHCVIVFVAICSCVVFNFLFDHRRVVERSLGMRKVCPNLDREDGLDTVLEVPVPELHRESPRRRGRRVGGGGAVKSWVRARMEQRGGNGRRRDGGAAPSRAEVQLMLGVVGAPLVPQRVEARKAMVAARRDVAGEEPLIEASKARYIVEQYVAAAGGEAALGAATSMYAMGKVRMRTIASKGGNKRKGGGEVAGGFVVWQKRPELWCVEMVVAGGTKMSAGSDGNVAWRQTPWQEAHASRGPPRPLRRCVQGLDPKSTADLFSSAAWVCERCIDGDDCFVLRVDASHAALRARSSGDVEVVRHAVLGYFSQRTGLLVRLEDSHLLRVRLHGAAAGESAYWETTMESSVGDYRAVDGINIAHAGRTVVSLSRFDSAGDADADAAARGKRSCTTMEETWSIEEVDFNVVGLSMDCFLPPRDLVLNECKKQQHHHQKVEDAAGDKDIAGAAAAAKGGSDEGKANGGDTGRGTVARKALVPAVTGLGWFGPAKVVAVDDTVDDAAPAATDDDK
ncbi:uncharacterized protein LOC102717803 [Oryza brachyantha]|uniref:uncharacterized protein LOC102717803 n=1 Tax=Oryza brachyantha TaxID=4533 RepID=UPI001ADACEFE|nr:uncharacterized protein LOC102717803 [Oryza brachyantha]